MMEHVCLESAVMQLAARECSPFVCGALGAYYTRNYLYIVMEYLPGGSLFFHLRVQPQPFSREQVLFYAAELLCALQFLHERSVVYR
jgi:serine/threonine protein kinase